jgi:hypothetical protein
MSSSDELVPYYSIFWTEHDDSTTDKLEESLKRFTAVPDNEKTAKALLCVFSLLSSLEVSHDIFHYDVAHIQRLLPLMLVKIGHLCSYLVFDEDSYSNFHEFLEALLDDILDYYFVFRKSIYHQKHLDPRLEIDAETQALIESLFTLLLLFIEFDHDLYYFIIPTLANHFHLSKSNEWRVQFNYTINKLPEEFPFYEEEEEDEVEDTKDDYLYASFRSGIVS